MPRSRTQLYSHFVWATKRREDVLVPEWKPLVYGCIHHECRQMGCTVLALGGMPDHVHLLLEMPSTLAPAQAVKQAKGVSARYANGLLPVTLFLKWQEGYDGTTVSPADVPRVRAYVQNQESHHAAGDLWKEWEPSPEDDER